MTELKILIVDDDTPFVGNFAKYAQSLLDYDAQVIKTYNHAEAQQKLRENLDIDICFVDYFFGTGKDNGVVLARKLKEIKPDIILVLVTAYFTSNPEYLGEAVQSNCFSGFIDRGQVVNALNEYLNENPALKLKLQEREAKKQAKSEKQRGDAYASTVKKYSAKELLSALVRMYCTEKIIAARQELDDYKKLDVNENIKMSEITAGIEFIEEKYNFKIANIGKRNSKEFDYFIDEGILDKIKNLVINQTEFVQIKRLSKDVPLGNRKTNSFFSENKLKIVQILKDKPNEFPYLSQHYAPVKEIKEEFKL